MFKVTYHVFELHDEDDADDRDSIFRNSTVYMECEDVELGAKITRFKEEYIAELSKTLNCVIEVEVVSTLLLDGKLYKG